MKNWISTQILYFQLWDPLNFALEIEIVDHVQPPCRQPVEDQQKMSVTVPGVRNHAIEIKVATDVYSKKTGVFSTFVSNTTFINVPIQCPSLSRSVCIFAKIWKVQRQICFEATEFWWHRSKNRFIKTEAWNKQTSNDVNVVFQSRFHLQHVLHIIRKPFLWQQIYERCHCLVAFFGGNVTLILDGFYWYNSNPG